MVEDKNFEDEDLKDIQDKDKTAHGSQDKDKAAYGSSDNAAIQPVMNGKSACSS